MREASHLDEFVSAAPTLNDYGMAPGSWSEFGELPANRR
jgi:hypothetical protein